MKFLKNVRYIIPGLIMLLISLFVIYYTNTTSQAHNFLGELGPKKQVNSGIPTPNFLTKKDGRIATRVEPIPRNLPQVVKVNDFRFTKAEATNSGALSSVSLAWETVPGVSDGYVVQRTNDANLPNNETLWNNPPTNYGKKVKILNVYPDNCAYLKIWMNQNDPNTGQPISMNLISIDEVSLINFNQNPNGYLKDSQGNYKYDGIYFGSEDVNGGYTPGVNDLTDSSQTAVAKFADTGRSLILGHDTILSPGHPFFGRFASKLGLVLLNNLPAGYYSDARHDIGAPRVQFVTNGFLNEYPYALKPNFAYTIKPAHTVGQMFIYNGGATRWMEFCPPLSLLGGGSSIYNKTTIYDSSGRAVGDNNWYLVTKNNYAQIQTGHSVSNGVGACTPDEAKIIANMIYFTSTLNTLPYGEDHTVKDVTAPNQPKVNSALPTLNQVNLVISATDLPTNYFYRVKAKTNADVKYSDVVKVPVLSGLKGYIYKIDDSPSGSPAVVRNPTTGEVTNLNLYPNSAIDPQAQLILNRSTLAEKYLHVVAVDQANNVSLTQTINLSQYIWWKYQDKVLTIYPHELNGALDKITSDDGNKYWPWLQLLDQIEQVVINSGVTAKGDIGGLFMGMNKLQLINGLTNLNTSQATTMNSLFKNCKSLTSLDLSNFDTRNVVNMGQSFTNTSSLWWLKLGQYSYLANNVELSNPVIETKINDLALPSENYYCTDPQWREVGIGSNHDPKGAVSSAAKIVADSVSRSDLRIYVWDQVGKVTLSVPNIINFGQVQIPFNQKTFTSPLQNLQVLDNRNLRKNRKWQLNLTTTKFVNVLDNSKIIRGEPLYYQDSLGSHHLNSTAITVREQNILGNGYQDTWNVSYNLLFKAKAYDIPVTSGSFQATVTYTITDTSGI